MKCSIKCLGYETCTRSKVRICDEITSLVLDKLNEYITDNKLKKSQLNNTTWGDYDENIYINISGYNQYDIILSYRFKNKLNHEYSLGLFTQNNERKLYKKVQEGDELFVYMKKTYLRVKNIMNDNPKKELLNLVNKIFK